MKKEDMSSRLASSFDFPVELMAGVPKIVINGNDSILVENHGGIHRFSAEEVRLGCCCGEIVIRGRNLQLCLLKKDEVEATGVICAVAYEDEEGNEGDIRP